MNGLPKLDAFEKIVCFNFRNSEIVEAEFAAELEVLEEL